MSTPSGDPGNQWTQPGDPAPPVPSSPESPENPENPEQQPPGRAVTGYGTPSSPSYGKYGQGQAEPIAPSAAPQWGPPAPQGQPQWGQPGYVQPRNWQHPGAFRASGGLATAVIVLSVLYTVVTWLTVTIEPTQQQGSFADALNGNAVETSIGAAEVIGLLGIPVLIGVWVVTSLWLSRARANAVILRPEGQRRSEGWAWFGWVLPIVYLWFPKQILDDTAAATVPASGDTRPFSSRTYWALWVTSVVLGVAASTVDILSTDRTGPRVLGYAEAIALTIALVPWIQIVRRLSAAQDTLTANGPVQAAPPTLEQ